MGCKNSRNREFNNKDENHKDYFNKNPQSLIQEKEKINIIPPLYEKYENAKYDENELMRKLNIFLDKVIIQDLIFKIPRSLKDSVFDMINEKEKEKLIQYLTKEKK